VSAERTRCRAEGLNSGGRVWGPAAEADYFLGAGTLLPSQADAADSHLDLQPVSFLHFMLHFISEISHFILQPNPHPLLVPLAKDAPLRAKQIASTMAATDSFTVFLIPHPPFFAFKIFFLP
jgi:hypothetical protein